VVRLEVLITDQEHPGGEHRRDLRAKRYGIVVKKVALPKPVAQASEALNKFNDAVTVRTRAIFFSHITTLTGVGLPARELCSVSTVFAEIVLSICRAFLP
jgi:isopenicillin-N epimerase